MSDPISRLNAALEGRYRVEREIGAGGRATIYLAEDFKHERKVAITVLRPELASALVARAPSPGRGRYSTLAKPWPTLGDGSIKGLVAPL